MDGSLFTAAHARTVASGHRHVVVLLEEDGRKCTDALLEIVDVDESIRSIGKLLPELPVAAQLVDGLFVLTDGDQSSVRAFGDTEVAALAGFGIDGHREEPAHSLLLRVGRVEERPGLGERELG